MSNENPIYQLSYEVLAHENDVRSLKVVPEHGMVISGGRDSILKIWSIRDSLKLEHTIYDHEHWVNAIVYVGNGRFATGSQDTKVRCYDLEGNLLAVGHGHRGAVTSIAADEMGLKILSGSWDSTARKWTLPSPDLGLNGKPMEMNCDDEYPGHENGCCVLFLPNNTIVTGSAGIQNDRVIEGSKLRIWQDRRVLESKCEHTGPIRDLCLLGSDNQMFASCSNDGTVRVYSCDTLQNKMVLQHLNKNGERSSSFMYSVVPINDSSGVAVAVDENCARIWDLRTEKHNQDIPHPATVWCLEQLPNGDIITGSSDGYIRVFSSNSDRIASLEVLQEYNERLVKSLQPGGGATRNGSDQNVNPNSLPTIAKARPGDSDGDIKMFNRNGEAWVYQWSSDSGAWIEVGSVVGSPDQKQHLNGEQYDKVFPIEVERHGRVEQLKLGFNSEDNPYVVARKFVEDHDLSESHVNEIVKFIGNLRTESQHPTFDLSKPIDSQPSINLTGTFDAEHQGDANRNQLFPFSEIIGVSFEKVDLVKVRNKIVEFNDRFEAQGSNVVFSKSEIDSLNQTVDILLQRNRFHITTIDSSVVKILVEKAVRWDEEHLYPLLDLLRAVLIHGDGAKKAVELFGGKLFLQSLDLAARANGSLGTSLCGCKLASNHFRHRIAARAALEVLLSERACTDIGEKLVSLSEIQSKSVRLAVASVTLNCANALCHVEADDAKKDSNDLLCAALLVCSLRIGEIALKNKEAETLRRCLLAIGCLVCIGDMSVAERRETKKFIDQLELLHPELTKAINDALSKSDMGMTSEVEK